MTSRRCATLTLLLVLGGTACGPSSSTPASDTPTTVPGDATTRPSLPRLSTAERLRAEALTADLVRTMVAETPKLTGMSVAELSPVFDEDFVRPIGAMAHLVLPSVVRTARLDLIRSRGGAPEVVESDVTNLVALDAIVLFANGKVVTLAISPDASFAVDPATATNAVPVAAESHRSQEFGNTD